jgi:potassium-dependent mechanosensitive channel
MPVARQLLRLCAFAALAAWLTLAAAFAYDEAVTSQAERAAESFRTDLKRIESEVQLPTVTDAQLGENRILLEDIRSKALAQAQTLAGPLAELAQQIDRLGQAPVPGQREADTMAAQRKSLGEAQIRLQAAQAQLELVAVEAEQMAGRAASIQRGRFFSRIFEAGKSILNPGLWRDTGLGAALFVQRMGALLGNWWTETARIGNAWWLLFAPGCVAAYAAFYSLIGRRLRHWLEPGMRVTRSPDEFDRIWRVFRGALGTFLLLAVVLIVPVYVSLAMGGYLTPRIALIVNAPLEIFITISVFYVAVRRAAAPGQPAWRIVDLDDRSAARFTWLATLTAFVSMVAERMAAIADALYLPVAYTIGQSAVVAIAMLLLLALILLSLRNQPGLPDKAPPKRVYFAWASSFVPLIWLAMAVAALALIFGYVALGSFIAQQIFDTAGLIVVLFLLHHLVDSAVKASFDPNSRFGRLLRRATGLGERAIERLSLLFRTAADLLLIMAGLPLLFLQWTVTWVDFRALVNKAFFGFKVGDVTVSLWSVLLVVVVLLAGIVFTNLVVRWLDRRILAETRIDKGVQDSVRKGASYAGYILAVGFALGAAGLDFSNLAFVAGALGVGIGFGLQSIVNNFVSGLILLAERPVRVGDWVVLPAGEGMIKRINVRSTEIETFDNCTIIVPNSNLITEAVRNWTHDDTLGRFTVNVSAAYDSNAEAVRDLLIHLTRAHPKVLTYPEPQVTLSRFGPYAIDFEIKAHVGDVFEGVIVASDLRYEILKAFREKGITIPIAPVVSMPR